MAQVKEGELQYSYYPLAGNYSGHLYKRSGWYVLVNHTAGKYLIGYATDTSGRRSDYNNNLLRPDARSAFLTPKLRRDIQSGAASYSDFSFVPLAVLPTSFSSSLTRDDLTTVLKNTEVEILTTYSKMGLFHLLYNQNIGRKRRK